MKFLKITLSIVVVLVIVYFIGPRPDFEPIASPKIQLIDIPLAELDAYVARKESQVQDLKPDNQARIIWYDSVPTKTRYAVVYLHGFSASQEEGDPVHLDFAKRYGCNLYLSRLADHGIAGEEALTGLTPNQLIESAKEAVAIGQLLGEEVIVISCSTGGTLSIYLAAANPEIIDALLLFSPNVEIRDQSARILTMPWGLQLGKMIAGDFRSFDENDTINQYWTTKYRIEAIVALQYLLDKTMKEEVFRKITQPYLMGYFYKNDSIQDPTISVEAAKRFTTLTSTPENQKWVIAFPEVGAHVMTSYIRSKDLESVEQESFAFAEEVLKLQPVSVKMDSVSMN